MVGDIIESTMSIEGGVHMYTLPGKKRRSLGATSPAGRLVQYTGKKGYKIQHKDLPFEKDAILTVEEIYVGRSSSTVVFKEFPNIEFNTVLFKDVENGDKQEKR